jgi:hypothetical protein
MEGDDGGQIYVTVPARLVACSERQLHELVVDIDAHVWGQPEMTRVVYERLHAGDVVAGGMGGGLVGEDVWVHPRLVKRGFERAVRDVIQGRTPKLHV